MTETTRKKKLLDENKDIYISEHDKNLSYDALNQIIDAKKRYAQAAKDGDKEEMTRSNHVANAVRAKYGYYTAGNSGDEYKPFVYEDTKHDDYSSKYEDELDTLYDSVVNGRKPFKYDYTEDPAYKAYKSVYDKQGELAYDRAMAENSLRTSGVANTNAQSAAMQALGYYNSQLAAKIPELYEAAYQRHYKDEQARLDDLIGAYDIVSSREERDYSRHLDSIDDSRNIRDFVYRRDLDNFDRNYLLESDEWERNYKTESDKKNREMELVLNASNASMKGVEMLYDLLRDSIADEKWKVNYNLSAHNKGLPGYTGNIGSSGILDYARILFGNPNITMEDLQSIFGL